MSGIPLLRSAAFWTVIPAIDQEGLPVARLMADANVFDDVMLDTELLVPERTLWMLLDLARERHAIDDIGFRIGASHTVLEVPGADQMLSGQVSLLQLLRTFCVKLKAHNNCWNYWLTTVPDGLLLCRRNPPFDVGCWAMEQYAIAYMVDLVRLSAPTDWYPPEIWLQADEETLRSEKEYLMAARVHYRQPITAILIPDAYLPLPVRYGGSTSEHWAEEPIEFEFLSNLRQVIQSHIARPEFCLDYIADLVDIRRRTLQRQLERRETTFQKLVNKTRFEMARTLLATPKMTVSEIAYKVGYRSISAFDHQFRNWSGISPGKYRRAIHSDSYS